MHRCLHINEIIVSVAGYLRKYDTDLLHLALACRVFYEPAMDVLWACTPYAFEKLLLCLPSDVVHTAPISWRTEGKSRSFVTREPRSSEWSRFIHHSRRIKEVSLSPFFCTVSDNRDKITLDALNNLRSYFNGRCVFPNLQALKVQPVFETHLDLFVTEHLTSFCVEVRSRTDISLEHVFSKLERCASHLNDLSILLSRSGGISVEMSALSPFLPLCQNLTSLSTWVPITPQTLALLATSMRLKSLNLAEPVYYTRPLTLHVGRILLFASLESLELSGSARHIAEVLRTMSVPVIQHVGVTLYTADLPHGVLSSISEPALDDMFTALTRSPRLSTLSITVAACCEDRGLSYIPGTALLPLTRLSALTKLCVHSVHVDLQPADIAQLAAAWPQMQELGLANQFMYYGCPELDFHPSICIEDIYPFAERCPALHTLAVAVAGDIAPAVPCQNPRVARWSLRKLSLASSRFEEGEECARVAVFIREVFPAVCEEFHMLEEGAKSEIQELLL